MIPVTYVPNEDVWEKIELEARESDSWEQEQDELENEWSDYDDARWCIEHL